MTEPFYLTEGKGYWPDDEILFWTCPKCGQTNSSKNLEPITAKCSNCASTTAFSEGATPCIAAT